MNRYEELFNPTFILSEVKCRLTEIEKEIKILSQLERSNVNVK